MITHNFFLFVFIYGNHRAENKWNPTAESRGINDRDVPSMLSYNSSQRYQYRSSSCETKLNVSSATVNRLPFRNL